MLTRAHAYLAGTSLGPTLVRAVIGGAGIRLAGMFFGFLVGIQLARGLGPEGYGIYGLAMAVIAVLTVPTEFGFPQLATREVAAAHALERWGRIRLLLKWFSRTIVAISLLVILIVGGGLAFATDVREPGLSQTLLIGLFLVPFVALLHLYSGALRGLQHLVVGQAPDTLLRPALHSLMLFLVAWLAGIYLSPQVAMGLGVLAALSSMVAALMLLKTRLPAPVSDAVGLNTRRLWRDSLPMAMTEGMRMLQGHVVVFMLGLFAVASVVGYFKVASAIMLLVSTPIALFNLIAAPLIARLHQQSDYDRLQRLLSMVALAMTASCFALSLPFLLQGESLIPWIFGDEYKASAMVLNILIIGVLASAFFGASAGLLNMTGHAGRVSRASAYSLSVLVAACLIAIPIGGAIGGAIASVFSLALWNFLMWRDGKRILRLDAAIWGTKL